MNSIEEKFKRIEARLQDLFEGGASRLTHSRSNFNDLNKNIIESLSKNLRVDSQGNMTAPDQFEIQVNPQQLEEWNSNYGLLDSLSIKLMEYAFDEGIVFLNEPRIIITPKEDIPAGMVQIEARFGSPDLPQTNAIQVDETFDPENIPLGAYLILDGVKIIQLDQNLVKIGRNTDNQIILEDKRVSRQHALLRAINRQYVLFDLDSSGGTFVNGDRIHMRALHAGDVISLAGVPIVYGQEPPEIQKTQHLDLE